MVGLANPLFIGFLPILFSLDSNFNQIKTSQDANVQIIVSVQQTQSKQYLGPHATNFALHGSVCTHTDVSKCSTDT